MFPVGMIFSMEHRIMNVTATEVGTLTHREVLS